MSKKAPTKKPVSPPRKSSVQATKSLADSAPCDVPATVDPCCGMIDPHHDSYHHGFDNGLKHAEFNSTEGWLKRQREKLAALTDEVAEASDRLRLLEVERANCANAIARLRTSLGF